MTDYAIAAIGRGRQVQERLTKERLAEIKARLEGATTGPLEVEMRTASYPRGKGYVLSGVFEYIGQYDDAERVLERKEDAEFFAHAEPDMRALLSEVEALREELSKARAWSRTWKQFAKIQWLLVYGLEYAEGFRTGSLVPKDGER